MKKARELAALFWSMLKIGLFTFGGGYAMINLLDHEFVERKRWIDGEEFVDLVAVAESTPGPIAINCATFIGYKRAGLSGAIFATLGMCVPSLTVIYLISLFFDSFLDVPWVASAFRGIQAAVVFLILSAGLKMMRKMKKKAFNISIVVITFTLFVTFGLLSVTFSSIFYILIFGAVGFLAYAIKRIKNEKRREETKK